MASAIVFPEHISYHLSVGSWEAIITKGVFKIIPHLHPSIRLVNIEQFP
jgi:hypothetical protein